MKFRLWCFHNQRMVVQEFQGETLEDWDAIGPEWGPLVVRTYHDDGCSEILTGEHYLMTREGDILVSPMFSSLKPGVTADRDLFPRAMDAAHDAKEPPA